MPPAHWILARVVSAAKTHCAGNIPVVAAVEVGAKDSGVQKHGRQACADRRGDGRPGFSDLAESA